jgi:hypothetical protein
VVWSLRHPTVPLSGFVRTVILYHSDPIQDLKADLIASQFPVSAFVHVQERRASAPVYFWRRLKRFGFGKVADEVLWRLAYRFSEQAQDKEHERQLVAELTPAIAQPYQRPPVHNLESINSDAGESLLRDLKPDVCIIMLNVMLKKRIFSIPPQGMLIFHPGLAPEYRGVHCGLWAVANNDLGRLGWSLLRIDEGVDTGPILAQGTAKSTDPSRESYQIMQHRAQFDGMPDVVAAMQRLARDEQPLVNVAGRTSNNYTHPGFSDYLRYRRMLKQFRNPRAAVPTES